MFNKIIRSLRSSIDRIVEIIKVKSADDDILSCEDVAGDLRPSLLVQQYGLASNLPVNTECVTLNNCGLVENSISIAAKSEFRPVDLASGDVVIYDNRHNKIELKDGKIIITAQQLEIESSNVKINGTLTADSILSDNIRSGTVTLATHIHNTTAISAGSPTTAPI